MFAKIIISTTFFLRLALLLFFVVSQPNPSVLVTHIYLPILNPPQNLLTQPLKNHMDINIGLG